MPGKYTNKEIIGLGALFLLLLTPFILIVIIKNPDDEKRLQTLRQIAAETPLYPNFKQINSSEGAKSTSAIVTVWYQVPTYSTSFDQVKEFYVKELSAKGWGSPQEDNINRVLGGEERELSFQKGEYRIYISWQSSSPNEYSIDYSWRRP